MQSASLGEFQSLELYRYRLELCLGHSWNLDGSHRAILWRGAFGSVFRSLVCHNVSLDCPQCPLQSACPYTSVFSPSIPPGRPAILRLSTPPRPFVLHDPQPDWPQLPGQSPLGLELTMVGQAKAHLPYFVVAFRTLGEKGLGRERLRFSVESMRALDAQGLAKDSVFEGAGGTVRLAAVPLTASALMRPGDPTARLLRVSFRTPTQLKGEGEGAPSFGTLIRRARDRLGALATFFGNGPLGIEPRQVGERADSVVMKEAQLLPFRQPRRSSRTGQTMLLTGLVGSVVYEGEAIGELMPWLRLAERVGVGKHATFGLGRVSVEVLEQGDQ